MKAESIAPVLGDWEDSVWEDSVWEDSVEAIVWDGAKGHQGEEYDEVEVSRIQQPPYPESLRDCNRSNEFSNT